MSEDLNEKVAIITGGNGVLGGAVSMHLAFQGVRVVILSRNEGKVQEKVSLLNQLGGNAIGFGADVLNREDLTKVRDTVLDKWGRIDILINAAGGNLAGATIGPEQTIFDMSMEDFSTVTTLNLNGSVLPSMIFGAVMCRQGTGSIINFSSMAADRVITRVAGYSASKAAIENFTKWMAVELALKYGEGVRVNAIAPGFFIGEQNRFLLTRPDGSYTERGNTIIKNTPMRRFGVPEEINGAIDFLASDASRFVTGIVIPIDGGFSAFSGV